MGPNAKRGSESRKNNTKAGITGVSVEQQLNIFHHRLALDEELLKK